jgi:hypothetical protein
LFFFLWPLCCLFFFFWPLCCLFFFFWTLCCLFFFDIRILITPFGIFKLFLLLKWDYSEHKDTHCSTPGLHWDKMLLI